MKLLLSVACAALILGAQGVYAEVTGQTPPSVAAFLASPTHCSVLIGGADRAGDGADRTYAESLNQALTAIGGPLESAAAISQIRAACMASPALSLAPERTKSPSSP